MKFKTVIIRFIIGFALIWLVAIFGASMGCATKKIDKVFEKNEVKIDSSNNTKIVEEVDTFATIAADTFDIFTPHLIFTDSLDTGGVIFDNHELNVIVRKKGHGTEIIIVKKEEKVPFKYHRIVESNTRLKKMVKNTSSEVHKQIISLPWWLWIIIIIILLILLYLGYRKLAKRFLWPYPF